MAEFLNTSKSYAEIEDVVNKAKNKVVLISPYIQIPPPLLARLKYIDGKGIKIVVVCRKDDLKAEARDDLEQLKHVELRFDENLHAKCFYNEETMVITSLNLYDYSQQNNREMGILLSLKDDHNVFAEARNEAEFIVNNAEKDNQVKAFGNAIKETKSKPYSAFEDDSRNSGRTTKRTRLAIQEGYCIRCKAIISYDSDAPYCRACYKIWAQYEDPDYPENVCHTCGRRADTSRAKPECNSCYKAGK